MASRKKPSRSKAGGKPRTPSKASKGGKAPAFLAFLNPVSYNKESYGGLWLAFLAVMAGLLALPNYNLLFFPGNAFVKNQIQAFPPSNVFAHLPSNPLILLGFIALIVLFRLIPPVGEGARDIPVLAARIGFWFFMAVGAYLRLENPQQPVGFFWDDHYTIDSDIRNMLDFHKYFFLFPVGWREPFFPYLSAFLWLFNPQATGQVVVLLADTIIDLSALWLFYLIGKEIGGRRMGLLLLAMGSICKTMVMVCRFEYGNDTCVLASAVAMLFFLRLLKKPDLKHFIEWGVALGFGAFTYVPFRPWMPVFLGATWLWVFSHEKERRFNVYRLILGPGLLLAWAFLFIRKNSLISQEGALVHFLAGPGAILVVLTLVLCYVKVFLEEEKRGWNTLLSWSTGLLLLWFFLFAYLNPFLPANSAFWYSLLGFVVGLMGVGLFVLWIVAVLYEGKKGSSKLLGWATGALVTGLIMSPFYLHPNYSEHVSDISAFSAKFTAPGQGWQKVWENNVFTWKLLFGQVDHVSRLPAIGDSLYEFMVAACALLGLAFFVARPGWLQAFVVALFFVSTTAGTLSNGPHSFRYVICDLPLLLVGAWGLNRLWLGALQAFGGKWTNLGVALLFLTGWGWEAAQNHKLVWEWMGQEAQNTIVWDGARKEMPDHRVYLMQHDQGFYAPIALLVLSDGTDLFQATDSNTIDLTPGEKGKDLALFVYGKDPDSQKKIEAEFPDVQWNKKSYYLQGDNDIPYLWWAEIPFDKISTDEKALFHVRRVSPSTWRRRCYGYFGLGRGLILYEDRVARWNDNLPPRQYIDWNNSMRVEGDWNVPTAGKYKLSLRTQDVLWFFLDGKKVLEITPEGKGTRTREVSLDPGVHHVELVTAFAAEHDVPTINVVAPGSPTETPLDELAAQTAPGSTIPPEASNGPGVVPSPTGKGL